MFGSFASVTDAGGTTGFVYDPNGQRLLRQTGNDATVYFAGHEITADNTGTTVEAVRSYTFDGKLVAVRTPSDLTFTVTDRTGSVELGIQAGSPATITADRAYQPYGQTNTINGSSPPTAGSSAKSKTPQQTCRTSTPATTTPASAPSPLPTPSPTPLDPKPSTPTTTPPPTQQPSTTPAASTASNYQKTSTTAATKNARSGSNYKEP